MSQYYLMAQLPSLDMIGDNMPLPITEERFLELCERLMGKNAAKVIESLTLSPPQDGKNTGNRLVDAWYNGERQLRIALAIARAEKMKKTWKLSEDTLPVQFLEVAKTATEMTDPMAAERYLNNFRLEFLETIRPSDGFSDAAVFYYALRLKLMTRMRQFDQTRGQVVYRNIYTSIMHGGEEEPN